MNPALAFLCLVLLACSHLKRPRAETSCQINGRFNALVTQVLGAQAAHGSFAFSVIDRADGQVLCAETVNPELTVYPASTIKTLIAAAILRKPGLELTTPVTISQSNAAAECADWGCDRYAPGRVLTVRELLVDMLTVSNNLATNQLIDVAGRDFINATADTLGATSLRVHRKVYNSVDPEPEITARNRADAAGFTALYRALAAGAAPAALPEPARATLLEILRGQQHNDRLNADFPAEVFFFHKPGNTSRVTGDAGFFHLDDRRSVVLVALQDFASLTTCADSAVASASTASSPAQTTDAASLAACRVSGYDTLRRIGRGALDLARAL